MTAVYVETKRLLLRRMNITDLNSFYNYRNNPEVNKYQGWLSNPTKEDAKLFIQSQLSTEIGTSGEWTQIAIEIIKTKELIGDIGLLVKEDNQAQYGITISKQHQRKGLAKEAVHGLFNYIFGTLKLHRIIGLVDTDNISSIRLQESIGMRKEGHFKKSYFDKNVAEWRDEYLFAILHAEWDENF